MIVKTTDNDFVRDTSCNALINTNVNAYKQYKLARQNRKSTNQNEDKIKAMQEEISELKQLVRELLKEKNV